MGSAAEIRKLTVSRFRGIEKLEWRPASGMNIILGGGDVGKTTILEAIALLRRQGFSLEEVPVAFKPRQAGESSIRAWGTVNFAAKVFLALFVDRLRSVDPRGSATFIKRCEGAAP